MAIIQGNSLLAISLLPEKPDYCSIQWLSYFWPANLVKTAARICQCESQGDPDKVNDNLWGFKEYSVGLFQINLLAHTQYNEIYLKNPYNNAEVAFDIYESESWGAWYWCWRNR